jgi:hypothetical protein
VNKATWQKVGLGALALLGGALLLGAKPARGHGTITAPGVSYTPSMDEWLWLARACYGESRSLEGQTAAAWAMVQRFAALRQTEEAWTTRSFTALVRGFSQPVNPIWQSNSKCTSDGRGCCGRCSQDDLDHRAFVSSRSWAWFQENEPDLYFMILSFSGGAPPSNPVPGATNFAACNAISVALRTHATEIGGNCFISAPEITGRVRIVPT